MKTKKPTGYVIYEGASELNGEDIIAVALLKQSKNSKTGAMIQTVILVKDIDPITANRIGEDYSICGNCPHKGIPNLQKEKGTADKRPCYVTLAHTPLIVYKSYKKGNYPMLQGHEDIAELGKDKEVRLGTYGDPSAVPSYVWDSLLSKSKGRTGYSHQFGVQGADVRPDMCMIIVESTQEAEHQWALGNRTFRVGHVIEDMVKGKEILCPASEEAGRRTTCMNCMLCSGNKIKAKSIFIVAHGNGKKYA